VPEVPEQLALVRDATTKFWDAYLKDDPDARADVESGGAVARSATACAGGKRRRRVACRGRRARVGGGRDRRADARRRPRPALRHRAGRLARRRARPHDRGEDLRA
jgi:hypothetical protein